AARWPGPRRSTWPPFPTRARSALAAPRDVTVSRQVLAEPSLELAERSWARLGDGTPLVTAAPRGKGWIVLFHVTASPAWSSLPLSGLYVEMLRRMLDLASGAHPGDLGTAANAVFPPLMTLDGFGRLQKPPADVLPVKGAQLAHLKPSPAHPPGLYGAEGSAVAINAVGADTTLTPLGDIGVPVRAYSGTAAIALQAPLLAIALLLLLADVLISLWLRGYLANARRWTVFGATLLLLGIVTAPMQSARAED